MALAARTRADLDAAVEGWEQVINTNLRGAYFMTQAVGKVMVRQPRGKIISIAY